MMSRCASFELSIEGTVLDGTAKARNTTNSFLNIWKDADAGIAILLQAQAEYARLQ
jgi:hypothetical protein